MDRRSFITSAASAGLVAGAAPFARPALAQGAAARTLRVVPHADLANFDPTWSSAYIVRNAGLMIWDTLYGMDDRLQPQRQMVQSEEVSADGLTWTFTLRPGLKFHDGEPVLAKDAVASINRWAVRESIGQLIKAAENELKPTSDRSFVWQLKRPFPKIPLALGHFFTPCFIMPARVAATDPAKPISDHTGSGPLRFVANEWVPGARALFETFAGYVPRSEPSSGMAGAKRMLVDRVEWVIIPDPATATAALQSGEVDWLEYPLPDLIPLLRKNKDVVVRLKDTVGQDGVMRLNHLHPPFNDVRARRALLMALSQEDFMRAFVGDDDSAWKRMPGFFNPGTPLYTEDGGEILKGPRNIAAAKKLLAESGYSGEPVTMLVAEDNPVLKVWGDVAADLLKQLDIKVDFVATDWGTVIARRTQKAPPAQGGWNIYLTWLSGVDCMDASNKFLRANGEQALPGWPSSPEVEREISAWYDAKTPDDEKAHIRALNRAALENVTYAPLGVYLPHYAWRKNVTGIAEGAVPLFWGVAKSA